jgi:hypothetical protein
MALNAETFLYGTGWVSLVDGFAPGGGEDPPPPVGGNGGPLGTGPLGTTRLGD